MSDVKHGIENPWREFIENCISGSNYFRASEYLDLLADLDRGYAAEARLADAVKALQAIADYPPGTFRPLADEIAIWRIATDAIDAARAADSADATAATPEGE